MRRVLLLLLVVVAGVAGASGLLAPRSAGAEAPVQAPDVPDRFVLRPSFSTSLGPVNAGSAFALAHNGKTVLVTALHLLGPAGGLKAQVEPGKLGSVVQSVAVRGAFTGQGKPPVSTAKDVVAIAGAHPMGDDAAGDILVLAPEEKTGLDRLEIGDKPKLAPGSLASAAPKVGDPVWLAAAATNAEGRAHVGKVVEINDKWLFYEIAQSDLSLAGTNGAPILNAAGEVVGIQLGGGVMDDGKLVGAANPWSAVHAKLSAALGGG